jgi:hypothetical protein
MATNTLENRVAALEGAIASLQEQLTKMQPRPEKKGILSIAGSMKDFPEFEDVIAFGRYFRVTGKEAPPDWNPGDPIPGEEVHETNEPLP